MPRRKEVARKNIHDNASSSRRATNEREEEVHHMASWFNNTQALTNYILRWEKRPFIAPRYINFEFLQSSNFHRLINGLETQHLGGLVMMENDYYPDLVSGSLSSLRFVGTKDGGYIEAYMDGRIRVISLSVIASLCNLSMDGVPFRGGLKAHDSWENYSLQDGLVTIGYRGNVVGKLSVNLVPTDIRILHYLLTYTILPRGGNHGVIQHEDVLVMWAMLKGYKICWPFFIIQHMLKFQGKANKPIGYGPLWSKIYEYLEIDVQGARKVVIDSRCCIDATTIKQMRRQLEQQSQGVDEVDEEENRLEEEEQAPQMGQEEEGQPGPSSFSQDQPTMRDIMKAIQTMEINMNQRMDNYQASIDERFQNFEREQRRIWQSVRRMEAWTFNEDLDEDDNQDEDDD
ncbi:hypothetical protein PIB30_108474 [Stylosanthes scabra]|uniref:Uncharacterized protein n=1 Tax=Stylosanthes scabra TaxID=79078 RepID=A0ABU6YX59_9FABA|nr:hypothetical protein [Stylosanthes scabra]